MAPDCKPPLQSYMSVFADKSTVTLPATAGARDGGGPAPSEVFEQLEALLAASDIRDRRGAKPVLFDIAGHGRWLFDPLRAGRLIERVEAPSPGPQPLRLCCGPKVLARLVASPSFELQEDDEVWFEGEVDDLLPLAEALVAQRAQGAR
jgi:hypothetical protein